MPEHVDVTDPEIHEPKGVSTASSGQIYVANGAGSGVWTAPGSWAALVTAHGLLTDTGVHEPKNVSTASNAMVYEADGSGSGTWTAQKIYLTVELTDISTASSAWTVAPVDGVITNWWTVIHNVITTANATLTLELGGVTVSNSAITVAFSGSAAGDVDTAAPTGGNTVSIGDAIEVVTNGNSDTTTRLTAIIEISRT